MSLVETSSRSCERNSLGEGVAKLLYSDGCNSAVSNPLKEKKCLRDRVPQTMFHNHQSITKFSSRTWSEALYL